MEEIKYRNTGLTSCVQSLIGELWAKQESRTLKNTFAWMEWMLHTGTVLIFGCVGILILPFVRVYTNGVSDANYMQPLFSVLISLANAVHCLRIPYHEMIKAAGHYKQTQSNYIVAAILNIVISVLTVNAFGLIGVAIGTLVAMVYQTIWMAIYDSRNLIKWPIRNFVKQVVVDVVTVLVAAFLSSGFELAAVNYVQWVILAVKVGSVWLLVVCVMNTIFYREKMQYLLEKVVKSVRKYV